MATRLRVSVVGGGIIGGGIIAGATGHYRNGILLTPATGPNAHAERQAHGH